MSYYSCRVDTCGPELKIVCKKAGTVMLIRTSRLILCPMLFLRDVQFRLFPSEQGVPKDYFKSRSKNPHYGVLWSLSSRANTTMRHEFEISQLDMDLLDQNFRSQNPSPRQVVILLGYLRSSYLPLRGVAEMPQ